MIHAYTHSTPNLLALVELTEHAQHTLTHRAKLSKMQEKLTRTFKSGLKVTDVTVGVGAEAVSGRRVTVHYTGTLLSGVLLLLCACALLLLLLCACSLEVV